MKRLVAIAALIFTSASASWAAEIDYIESFVLAKDREARYSSPEDLIIDIQNLLDGKAPVLAGSSTDTSSMASLVESDDGDDFAPSARNFESLQSQLNTMRIVSAVLAVALVGSLLAHFLR